jgi:hypothetical protein
VEFLENDIINIEYFPQVFIAVNDKFYGFENPPNRIDLFLHQFNRVLNPLLELTSLEQVKSFIDTSVFPQSDFESPIIAPFKADLQDISDTYNNY